MADTATTDWADLLYDLRGPLQEAYPKAHPLTSKLQRDTSRENFSGKQVRVPIFTAELEGFASIAEGGTVATPQKDDTAQAHIDIAHHTFAIRFGPELIAQTKNNAAAKAVASKVERARQAMASRFNEELHCAGGLLAAITSGTTGTLVIGVGTSANWRLLRPGRIVDILTKADGTDPGQGLKRKIASVSRSAGTVTFSTTSFGGGSGNITFSTSEGIYLAESYGDTAQSIQDAMGTGTFQNITIGSYWQAVDGRDADTTDVDPDLAILDAGLLQLGEAADDVEDNVLQIGDPGVILKYQQSFYSQMRYRPETKRIDTGFEGPDYQGRPWIGDYSHKRNSLSRLPLGDMQLYAYGDGPDWDTLDGNMFRRTDRTRQVEAWLADDVQLGFHELRRLVHWDALNRAA